ncbi:MAG: RNA polymerase sigma factor [Thermoleophilia bacterium]
MRNISLADDVAAMRASCADPEEFVRVFELHFDEVHRFVAARVGADAADDVTSDTFTVAFRRRERFDATGGEVRPWLLGIALNVMRNHHRARRRWYGFLAHLRPDPPEDATGELDARVDAAAAGERINAALGRLRTGDREVFLLAACGELTYPQIATALGIPVGTVRSRMHRARAALRADLEELTR